ncbi:Fic family protein [Demequina pelophila]|uniref:Fic family protein n=1 Tax=Demequina pelophila TaxID=1638984 RepID=UPI000783F4E9|nr:Fic family protein [Demequina pelophila]
MGHFERIVDEQVNDGQPYRAYIPGRLQDIELAITPAVQARIDRSSRRIAEIDKHLGQSPSLPALESLVKSESIASSYIEGHQISVRDLARGSSDVRGASADVRAVLGNIAATQRAVRSLGDHTRDVTIEDVIRIQSDLMETHPRGGARSPYVGLRTTQAVLIPPGAVRGETASIDSAAHVPPPASKVGAGMADLMDYINAGPVKAPALVRAALAHAQFETIHPFPDGNGRTGRALIQGMLRRDGVVVHVVLPLSPYLAMNTERYVEGLNSVRFGGDAPHQEALNRWLEMFADCAYSSAANAAEVASAIADISREWMDRLTNIGVRSGATARRAVSYIAGTMATTTRDLAAQFGTGEDTARTALTRLEKIGAVTASRLDNGVLVYVAEDVADVVSRSQKDVAVASAPAGESRAVQARGLVLPGLDTSRAPRGAKRANPAKVCGVWMPRSRQHCTMREGHVGWPDKGHRHIRR